MQVKRRPVVQVNLILEKKLVGGGALFFKMAQWLRDSPGSLSYDLFWPPWAQGTRIRHTFTHKLKKTILNIYRVCEREQVSLHSGRGHQA